MSNCKVHNVRFYKPKPKAISCMALHSKQRKLAVSRSDTSIEIWNLNKGAFIERTIPSSTENFSIEGLSWCGDRLFSVGLHGLLIEYNLFTLSILNRLVVTGEAAFCLDINKSETEIAIGTEQGYINIFQIVNDEVLFSKFLDKQEGRILCLKYDYSGNFIVTGSLDTIRIWNVKSGHALHKMTTGRAEAKKTTIVWTLAVTTDFTIISGDSRGKLTFWDGKVGAQIESYQSHRADILAVCLSSNEDSLYCAGVDPIIIHYSKITVKEGTSKWIKSIQRKVHDHDVRALALLGNKLYSSGVDGYLTCSYYPPKTLLKFPPILQSPCAVLCSKARLLLLRHPKYVEIWSLGESDGSKREENLLNLKCEPKKLIVLQRVTKDEEGIEKKEGIYCASMSSDGQWVFLSTRQGIRIFNLIYNEDKPCLLPVSDIENDETPCVCAVFSPTNQLMVTPNCGGIRIYRLLKDNASIIQNIDTKSHFNDTITFLILSNCGKYLAGADPQGNIVVWMLKNEEYKFYCKLPFYKCAPCALAIHPTTLNLVVAYGDNNIVEYDLMKRELSTFSRCLTNNIPKQWLSRPYPIRNVTFDPRTAHIIILHDDNNIIVVNKEKEKPGNFSKIPKIKVTHVENDNYSFNYHLIKKYKHLVHLSWLSNDEIVAVEVNPLSFIEQLPACFIQNSFGCK